MALAYLTRYPKYPAGKDQFQKIFEHGDKLKASIAKLVVQLCGWLYADEEVKSNYGYLSGYKPKSITEQTTRLRELFPGIGYANEKLVEQPLLENAEGDFAIPRWDKIAPTHGEAVVKVFDLLEKTLDGKFTNYLRGRLGPQYLRLSKKTAEAFAAYYQEQAGYDIIVITAQFGLRHTGRSVRRALEVMLTSEFGLDPFTIGIMLLTHPERLMDSDDLWIDCAGAEYSPFGVGDFSQAPGFFFYDGRVGFDASDVSDCSDVYGSASGFRPPAEACTLEG